MADKIQKTYRSNRRWLICASAAIVVITILWVRGRTTEDWLEYSGTVRVDGYPHAYDVVLSVGDGELELRRFADCEPIDTPEPIENEFSLTAHSDVSEEDCDCGSNDPGRFYEGPLQWQAAGFAIFDENNTEDTTRVFRLPYWFAMSAAGLAAVVSFSGFRSASKRLREGRCLQCGYDLRATPDRCPECGRENLTAKIDSLKLSQ